MLSSWLRVWRGEPDGAIDHAARAMRLSPLDPNTFAMNGALPYAHFLAGRFDKASSSAEKAIRDNPKFVLGMCISSVSNLLAARYDHAELAIARALELDPKLRVSILRHLAPCH